MSAHTMMAAHPMLDEGDLKRIEAEAERIGTGTPYSAGQPIGAAPAGASDNTKSTINDLKISHPFEWRPFMSPKTRNLDDLRSWVLGAMSANGAEVNSTDLLAKHIGATGSVGRINASVDDFLVRLNRTPGFSEDGLGLMPGDLPSNPTVNQLLKAIIMDYERRDIEVIL